MGFDFGGFVGSLIGQHSAQQSNTANNNQQQWLASENRAWQQMMSNTAHTREVSDLRNAGLNPILSATGGQGASTPSPSMATTNPNPPWDPAAAMQSALQMKTMSAGLKKMGSETKVNDELAKTQMTQQILNKASTAKTVADTGWADLWNKISMPLRAGVGAANSADKIKKLNENIKHPLLKLPDPYGFGSSGGHHPILP